LIELNEELTNAMKLFNKKLGKVIPLREIPPEVTNDELMDAINYSITNNQNILPERFGYGELDKNSDIII
jgi:hypothetical protein